MDHKPSTIAISGVSRGIGEGLARAFLDAGWSVHGLGRRLAPGWDSSPPGFSTHLCELSELASVQAACEEITEPLDVLVCNAATFAGAAFHAHDFDAAAFAQSFVVNTVAPTVMAKALKARLLQGERRLIVMMSTGNASLSGNTEGSMLAYRASKSALNQVVRTLAANWGPEGITTVALNPGWVRTDMGGDAAPLSVDEAARAIQQFIVNKAGPALNGGFVNPDGSALPW